MTPFKNSAVKNVFDAYPENSKVKLLHLRQLIFDTAAAIKDVGEIEETLKWGQPAYLTTASQSGTTIRIDQVKPKDDAYGLFVHCQTSLMATYRELYPGKLEFEGNRMLRFHVDQAPPEGIVKNCIALALTYHLDKNKGQLPF